MYVDCTGDPWTLTERLRRPSGQHPRGSLILFNDVLVIFPQSNLKNRRQPEYTPIGAKFPPKITMQTLNTAKKYSKIS
jgi:hypothetical protein